MTDYRIAYRGPAWRGAYTESLSDPERIVKAPSTRILQRNDRRTVALADVDGNPLVLKLFAASGVLHGAESLLTGTAAFRALRSARRMTAAGFGVPEVVAVLECGPRLVPRKSCLVTRAVTNGLRVDRLWATLRRRERRVLGRCFASYARELHDRGLYPQDLRAGNVLAVPAREGWSLVLVDLDRVRRYRRLSWRRRRKNLVQVDRSLGRSARLVEKIAFLHTYLGEIAGEELVRLGREIRAAGGRKDAKSRQGSRGMPRRGGSAGGDRTGRACGG